MKLGPHERPALSTDMLSGYQPKSAHTVPSKFLRGLRGSRVFPRYRRQFATRCLVRVLRALPDTGTSPRSRGIFGACTGELPYGRFPEGRSSAANTVKPGRGGDRSGKGVVSHGSPDATSVAIA